MNDATEWIDPELVAAGKLLQSRGLVAPTARRRHSPRCAPLSTASGLFTAKARCHSPASATCPYRDRTARYRAPLSAER
jgi:hypothetical protein